jgi:hypothetical protein
LDSRGVAVTVSVALSVGADLEGSAVLRLVADFPAGDVLGASIAE